MTSVYRERLSTSTKAILLGLFLSKFDKEGLNALGFGGFWEAFNTFAYAIGVRPSTIKNYRDEFDPYFPNVRKGWHGRQMKAYCKPVFSEFSSLPFDIFVDLVRFILIGDDHLSGVAVVSSDQSDSVAKRLITGKSAEEYFRINYQAVPSFKDHELTDTTVMACGYDFETYQSGSRQYCVEVKGLSKNSGNISLTQKEFAVAEQFKERYCLFIVLNFDRKPTHQCHFDPVNSHIKFKRTERHITQITYSASI